MKVAVNGRFLAAVQTGVQRFALEITRRLLARADAVIVVPRGAVVPAELSRQADVVEGRLKGHTWEQIELPDLARRAGADVCLGLANALPASGGPHAVVLHDTAPFDHPEWFSVRYGLWHRSVLLPAARRAAAAGSLTASSAGEVARVLGRRSEEIAVIPQGAAPFDAPAPPDQVADARRRFGLGESPYLLAIGAGNPRKNVAFLERVMSEWRGRDGGAQAPALVVVGSAPARVFAPSERSAGEGSSAGEHPAGTRVGRVEDDVLRALYAGAAAFCYPSLAEGFGRPPLEALACGTPVVVAPYGPAREVLADAAEVVPLDVEAWLAVLQRLVAHGAGPHFVERARAVVAKHRWEDGAEAALALCARAAEAGRGSRVARAPARGAALGEEAR